MKAVLDPRRAYAQAWEEERDAAGSLASTAVVFVTNRQCPFRCVMCDLWVNTLDETVPAGAITEQITRALDALPPARQIKLYNAGNFFDPQAIPPAEYTSIAAALRPFQRVIVEAHPAFLQGAAADRCRAFQDLLDAQLEVAIGLETVHAEALARLNKGMTLASFCRAAEFLAASRIDLRAFVLLGVPGIDGDANVEWACRSVEFAVAASATVTSVIPLRGAHPSWRPTLPALETVVEHGIRLGGGRVFADLWDVERLFDDATGPARAARLAALNRTQQVDRDH